MAFARRKMYAFRSGGPKMSNTSDAGDAVVTVIYAVLILLALAATCDRKAMRDQGYKPPPGRNWRVPQPSEYE